MNFNHHNGSRNITRGKKTVKREIKKILTTSVELN